MPPTMQSVPSHRVGVMIFAQEYRAHHGVEHESHAGHGYHVAKVCPTQQSHAGEHPSGQQQNAAEDPGIKDNADETPGGAIHRRPVLDAPTEREISGHIGEDDDGGEEPCFPD